MTGVCIAEAKGMSVAANDAKNCRVFNLDELPESMAFDHAQVLIDYKKFRASGQVTTLLINAPDQPAEG